ncbi:GGDEF domain-containing protein [Chitinispirillales bacterium ANBcel5]|uniref:diguanylate cyclase n=1 Tax=Cellulosispirillum alkaliphilum TaxID=3039283 RepID=UPI002A52CA82|nr:GGDEF domain-containing protein [Chitinispirillales bacterium ANBcel5]
MKKRPTIGLQISTLHQEYSYGIWSGAANRAAELDINLVIFRCETPNYPVERLHPFTSLYELINPNYLDALILNAGIISNFLSDDEFKHFFYEKYSPLPIVSLGAALQNIPSIIIDNIAGIKEQIDHLVLHHGYTSIGYIRGPANNVDAQIRFNAFKETLHSHNVSLDPRFVFEGIFDRESGGRVIRSLLSGKEPLPQAIISCNDDMAIGAINELLKNNIRVPQDIAITGFDDIALSKYLVPALTTVAQPLVEYGAKAVDVALETINGKVFEKPVIMPTNSVIRRSCGCLPGFMGMIHEEDIGKHKIAKISNDLIATKKNVLEMINEIITNSKLAVSDRYLLFGFSEKIIDAVFVESLSTNRKNELISLITQFSELECNKIESMEVMIEILQVTFISLQDTFGYKQLAGSHKNIFYKAIVILLDTMKNSEGTFKFQQNYRDYQYGELFHTIGTSMNISELRRNIFTVLNHYTIPSFYGAFYDRGSKFYRGGSWKRPQQSFLKIAITDGKLQNCNNRIIDLKQTILPKIPNDKRHTLVVITSFFKQNQFGYFIYELGTRDSFLYDMISYMISSAYRSILLFGARKKAEQKLRVMNQKLHKLSNRDALTGLLNRRGFLKFADKQLKTAKEMNKNCMVVYIDLDNLKPINDLYGHTEGDEAIRATAKILQDVFRGTDTIGRLGGDEFTTLLIADENLICQTIRNRILSAISRYNQQSHKNHTLSMSIGFAVLKDYPDATISELLQIADNRLYEDKLIKKRGAKNIEDGR